MQSLSIVPRQCILSLESLCIILYAIFSAFWLCPQWEHAKINALSRICIAGMCIIGMYTVVLGMKSSRCTVSGCLDPKDLSLNRAAVWHWQLLVKHNDDRAYIGSTRQHRLPENHTCSPTNGSSNARRAGRTLSGQIYVAPAQNLRELRVFIFSSIRKTTGTTDSATSRNLGLLKRDKALQRRYDAWTPGIVKVHGSLGG